MLALALVLEGHSREEAARHAGMDRQTLRDWVHRYNAEGLAGLHDRPRSGPKPRLTPEQMAELATVVEQGPDPETGRRGALAAGRPAGADRGPLRRRSCTSARSARCCAGSASPACRCGPKHPSSDPEAQAAFKKTSPELVQEALPEHAAGKPIEIWFAR